MKHRVWVTRDEGVGGELSAALLAVGLEPVVEPVVERRLIADPAAMLCGLREKDWLVLTSAFAARAFVGQTLCSRVAVVGEGTVLACRRAGIKVDLVSPEASGSSLWNALWPLVSRGSVVLYPRSSLATVPKVLARGVSLIAPVFYQNLPQTFNPDIIRSVEVASVCSPSAVHRIAGLRGLPRCASIGPTTSEAMQKSGIKVWVESGSHTFEDLASRIAEGLNAQGHL